TSTGSVTIYNYGLIRNTQPSTVAATGFTGFAINLGTSGGEKIFNIGTISSAETNGGGPVLVQAPNAFVIKHPRPPLISGVTGVQCNATATAGTLTNFGTIASTGTGTAGGAVFLNGGGTITNYGLMTSQQAASQVNQLTGNGAVIRGQTVGATIKNFG